MRHARRVKPRQTHWSASTLPQCLSCGELGPIFVPESLKGSGPSPSCSASDPTLCYVLGKQEKIIQVWGPSHVIPHVETHGGFLTASFGVPHAPT